MFVSEHAVERNKIIDRIQNKTCRTSYEKDFDVFIKFIHKLQLLCYNFVLQNDQTYHLNNKMTSAGLVLSCKVVVD